MYYTQTTSGCYFQLQGPANYWVFSPDNYWVFKLVSATDSSESFVYISQNRGSGVYKYKYNQIEGV